MTGTAVARLVAGGCLVLAAAAACGSPAATAGSGGPVLTESTPPAPTSSVPTSSVPNQSAAPGPHTPVRPVAPLPTEPGTAVPTSQLRAVGPARPPRGVEVSKDGRTVMFDAAQAGCQHVTAALVAQAGSAVTIRIRKVTTNSGGQLCPMIVREVPLAVRLAAPLGDREIVFEGGQPITSNH